MNKHQGPAELHRELYLISSLNHHGKEYLKKMYICVKLYHFAVQQRLACVR